MTVSLQNVCASALPCFQSLLLLPFTLTSALATLPKQGQVYWEGTQAITQTADEKGLIRSTFASPLLILEFVKTVCCYQLPPCSLLAQFKQQEQHIIGSLPGFSSQGGHTVKEGK